MKDALSDKNQEIGFNKLSFVSEKDDEWEVQEETLFYLDGITAFIDDKSGRIGKFISLKKKFWVLQIVEMENFEKIEENTLRILKKYDDEIVAGIVFIVVDELDKPTVPYMRYSRIMNSLKSAFKERIICCEYCDEKCPYSEPFQQCLSCSAYGFCKGKCLLFGFKNIGFNCAVQKVICQAKKNMVSARQQLDEQWEDTFIDGKNSRTSLGSKICQNITIK